VAPRRKISHCARGLLSSDLPGPAQIAESCLLIRIRDSLALRESRTVEGWTSRLTSNATSNQRSRAAPGCVRNVVIGRMHRTFHPFAFLRCSRTRTIPHPVGRFVLHREHFRRRDNRAGRAAGRCALFQDGLPVSGQPVIAGAWRGRHFRRTGSACASWRIGRPCAIRAHQERQRRASLMRCPSGRGPARLPI
jgi:hypothetical protein